MHFGNITMLPSNKNMFKSKKKEVDLINIGVQCLEKYSTGRYLNSLGILQDELMIVYVARIDYTNKTVIKSIVKIVTCFSLTLCYV